jgi:hypothetical protein
METNPNSLSPLSAKIACGRKCPRSRLILFVFNICDPVITPYPQNTAGNAIKYQTEPQRYRKPILYLRKWVFKLQLQNKLYNGFIK